MEKFWIVMEAKNQKSLLLQQEISLLHTKVMEVYMHNMMLLYMATLMVMVELQVLICYI